MGVVHWSPITTILGIANLIIFLCQRFFPQIETQFTFYVHNTEIYQYLSSIFLHANWEHLTGNAFFLFAFGTHLERRIGAWRYLLIYLLSGIGGNLLFELAYLSFDDQGPPAVLGASGAIFGLICSMAFLDWKAFVVAPGSPLPMPIFVFAFMFIGKEFFDLTTINEVQNNVAHTAHIGGGIMGALIAIFLLKLGKARPSSSN